MNFFWLWCIKYFADFDLIANAQSVLVYLTKIIHIIPPWKQSKNIKKYLETKWEMIKLYLKLKTYQQCSFIRVISECEKKMKFNNNKKYYKYIIWWITKLKKNKKKRIQSLVQSKNESFLLNKTFVVNKSPNKLTPLQVTYLENEKLCWRL